MQTTTPHSRRYGLLPPLLAAALLVGCASPQGTPTPTSGGFTSIAAGAVHSLALDEEGSAWAWGDDGDGQLGDAGTNADASSPTEVAAPTDLVLASLSGGRFHSLALDAAGSAWAWGSDAAGQLGDGAPNEAQGAPVAVVMPPATSFEQVAARAFFSLALDATGNAWAWGSDGSGQLGNGGTNVNESAPVAVAMPAGVSFTDVAVGGFHVLALDTQGNAWAWGSGGNGRLGDGGAASAPAPIAVSMPADTTFTAIAGGGEHTLALDADGNAWAWGRDGAGQLGDGGADADMTTPVPVSMPNGVSFVAIAAGSQHSLALDTTGNAWAWGLDDAGQLGDGGTNTNASTPVQVTMPTGVSFTAVSAGTRHSLALDTNGNVWAWGRDGSGQLGNGDAVSADQASPVQVVVP